MSEPWEVLEKLLTDLGPDWYLSASGGGGFNLWHLPIVPGVTTASRRCQQVFGSGSLASCVSHGYEILGGVNE